MSLCARFITALPVDHAAISTLGDPFDVETVCASDGVAATLDEIQLDSGVGPSWRARSSRSPVLVRDLQRDPDAEWPMLTTAAAAAGVASAYAFPMSVGAVDVGVVDLYAARRDALTARDVALASVMADAAALTILRDAMALIETEPGTGASARRFVHQATGMVCAQLRVTPEDALLIIRAHAFATGRSVREVAESLIARELDFSV
ncbi:ANTAR domain-containing protein [Microbacterium oleivorans]|uniref:ANTAR domain-containing protein n=1 Tax=Microbacterium oleivorans TaxID=273677 RepID=A0A7D5JDP1_9MICO|nr:ANTAR domain-containing protein [Microbacterium oleivorans]QLD12100.1 ANTAR domain-containing protein [Microbacterium oleivorans]